jgi:hypothetical protein
MNRLLPLLMAVVGGFMGFYASVLVYDMTRLGSNWVHVLVVSVPLIAGFMILVKKMQPRLSGSFAEALSEPGNEIGAFAIAVLLSSFMYKSNSVVQFYMDNGTKESVSFSVKETGNTYTVKPKEAQKVELPCGKITLTLAGKDTVVDFPNKGGYWIMNPKSANQYIEGKTFYSADVSAANKMSESDTTALNIVSASFFYTNADYLFTEPETITVSKKSSSSIVTKKILYRLRDINEATSEVPVPEEVK